MKNKVTSSFRDPSGFVYYENNKIYRQINKCYFDEYNKLMNSGLYEELINNNLLVKHKEIERTENYIIIEPEIIPYISYPYEWCFSMYKDAAILTLKINIIALKYDMILKDSSAYNIQFINGKPILIDTLSFYTYEGSFSSYGQYTRHFIAPLLLMNNIDYRLNTLMKDYIDGIPIDLCSKLLKRRGGFTTRIHIDMQSKSIIKHNNDKEIKKISLPKKNIINMLEMIERQINKLDYKYTNSEWSNYYENTNYDEESMKEKEKLVKNYISKIELKDSDLSYDIASNDGRFSRLINKGHIVSFDIDIDAVEKNYSYHDNNILPLVLDLNNPSPSIGFSNEERDNIVDRSKNVKLTLFLAVIHHMCISNNISIESLSEYLSKLSKYLIIEFVPKEDSQVIKLLSTRKDIFDNYNIKEFEEVFKKKYNIIDKNNIKGTSRTIYLMEKKHE